MGRAFDTVRAATAEAIRVRPDPALDEKPAPPEPPLAEESRSTLRTALAMYEAQLLPWKVFAAAVVAGLIVDGNDTGLFAVICLTAALGVGCYYVTEWRLTRQHVAAGRIEMGESSGRRVRRINRRARRSSRVGVAIGGWLGLVSLTDPTRWHGAVVWTLGAIAWGLTSYDGWWFIADTDPDPAPAAAVDEDDDVPVAAGHPTPMRAGHVPPAATRVPPRGRRGPAPAAPATAAPAHAPLPSSALLNTTPAAVTTLPDADHTSTIQELFTARKMDVTVVGPPARGPVVTRYTLELGPAVPVNKVMNMAGDLRLRCASPGLQVLSPVGGKAHVGVEIPNINREKVLLGTILNSPEAKANSHPLLVALGKDADGKYVLVTLAFLIHLLIAGATGGGKSGVLNAILVSILSRATPEEVKLLLIDLKRVELTPYNGIPHLLTPVVTDPAKAANALDAVADEMDQRYLAFEKHGVRNIDEYNHKVVIGEIVAPPGAKYPLRPYAYWVVMIDELAELMAVVGEDIEKTHQRLTAKARAAGIHLVDATQRPSVDVVTGIIKANIPSRLALACASNADSRTILDRVGAEKLLGAGDALFLPSGALTMQRLQIAWVETHEITAIVDHWKRYGDPTGTVLPEGVLDAPRETVAMPTPLTTFDMVLDAARRHADPDTGIVTRQQIVRHTPGINDKTRAAIFTKLFKRELEHINNGTFRVRSEEELRTMTEQETTQ